MIEWIYSIDRFLFRLINTDLSNSFLDHTMPIFTDLHKQGPFSIVALLVLIALWIYSKRKQALTGILVVISTFAITDSVSHHFIKPIFKRERPHQVLENVNLRTIQHSGYSMPSNHAFNNMAIAVVAGYNFMNLRVLFYFLALLIAFSRVYVGVHYPSDVLVGMILGYGVGLWMVKFQIWLDQKLKL
ncbi:MAG: phosphatase PAP2 family protein [Bdellovibrionales bacterium]|nr:phosphatase PAP2 family protein [Bdellovibrionales bacterium]